MQTTHKRVFRKTRLKNRRGANTKCHTTASKFSMGRGTEVLSSTMATKSLTLFKAQIGANYDY